MHKQRNTSTRIEMIVNHSLRGSASPVLTATGFVNGIGQISTPPPTESTPFDRSPNNLSLMITSATPTAVPHLVQIRPRGASGRMGENIKKQFYLFIYLYLFSGTNLQVRPVDGFSRSMAQTTRTRARVCFLGFR